MSFSSKKVLQEMGIDSMNIIHKAKRILLELEFSNGESQTISIDRGDFTDRQLVDEVGKTVYRIVKDKRNGKS